MTCERIFFLRIEPTSYVLALLRALREVWSGEIEAQFITSNASQPWEFDSDAIQASLLPTSPAAARKAIKATIQNDPRPALVHTAGWGATHCRNAISYARQSKVPVVVDHDTWNDSVTGLAAVAKRLILPARLKKVSHFASGGTRQKAFLRRYGVNDSKITPVNMTVDVLEIQRHLSRNPNARALFRQRFNLPQDAKIALFLGRLIPRKGVTDLLKAWSALAAKIPNVHLAIVGDGPMMAEVQAIACDRVHVLGRLSGSDVWDAYGAVDLCVAPSLWEPWGLVINEAMAAGVPVVMTDAFGCIGDLAIADQTACIARTGDPDDLSACMEKMLVSDEFRKRLQTNASKIILGWTIEHQARRIADVWKQVLDYEGP